MVQWVEWPNKGDYNTENTLVYKLKTHETSGRGQLWGPAPNMSS